MSELERYLRQSIQTGINPPLCPSWQVYGCPENDLCENPSCADIRPDLQGKIFIGTLRYFKEGEYPQGRVLSLLTDQNRLGSLIYGAVMHGVDKDAYKASSLQSVSTAASLRRGLTRDLFNEELQLLGINGERYDEFVSLREGFRALDVYEHLSKNDIRPEEVLTWKCGGQPSE